MSSTNMSSWNSNPSTASTSTSISPAPNAHAVFYFLRSFMAKAPSLPTRCEPLPNSSSALSSSMQTGTTFPSSVSKKDNVKKTSPPNTCKRSDGSEGLLFIGKAQEKVRTFRTEGRRNARGETYPWIVETTALVNQYYFYGVDADFGPFFLKYSSYFPYGAKLCFNGHEFLKRQLAKEGIGFEELANGILSCDNPARMQQLAHRLTPNGSKPFCASGSSACLVPSNWPSSRPATVTTSPCPKSNSP